MRDRDELEGMVEEVFRRGRRIEVFSVALAVGFGLLLLAAAVLGVVWLAKTVL